MSFDVNVLSSKPIIKAASSMQNDGGGGNLGYMAQGGRDEEQKRHGNSESIFSKKPETDTFGYQNDFKPAEKETFSFASLVAEIISSIRSLFTK